MKILVIPADDGVISHQGRIVGQQLPDGAVIVDFDGESLDIAPATAAVLVDGAIKIVPDWRGSGPWYDKGAALEDRETPIHITELGFDPREKPWAMTPRPLTTAEQADLAKAEAEALAAEAARRIADLEVSDTQLALAMISAKLITQGEAEAYVSVGTLPKAFEAGLAAMSAADRATARIKIMGAKAIKRSDPIVAAIGRAVNAKPATLDALFVAAASL